MNLSKLLVVGLLSVVLGGCAEERVVTDDPAKIEKERQKHLQMTRREMEER
jgi:hypothetical protein